MRPCIAVSLPDCVQRLKSELANLLYWSQSMSVRRIRRVSKEMKPGGVCQRTEVRLEKDNVWKCRGAMLNGSCVA